MALVMELVRIDGIDHIIPNQSSEEYKAIVAAEADRLHREFKIWQLDRMLNGERQLAAILRVMGI